MRSSCDWGLTKPEQIPKKAEKGWVEQIEEEADMPMSSQMCSQRAQASIELQQSAPSLLVGTPKVTVPEKENQKEEEGKEEEEEDEEEEEEEETRVRKA